MWLDALLSLVVALGCIVAVPVVATVSVPSRIQLALGIGAAICAAVLAALGVLTAVFIMERVNAGQYAIPEKLRLPLPRFMRPSFDANPNEAQRDQAAGP